MFKAVIFDFMRTLYDPDADGLMKGALELLTTLKGLGVRMVLVSMADGYDRKAQLQRLGLDSFFEEVHIVPRKDEDLFEYCIASFGLPNESIAVVGDHPFKEIAIGNRLGLFTIWLRGGVSTMLSDEEVGAKKTIHELMQALPILRGDES